MTAQAEGYEPSEVVVPVIEETDLVVWLRPAGNPGEAARRPATPTPTEIRKGRVLDSVTQAPLPGALVWQAGLDTGEDVPWTWTAADGSFRLAVRGPDPAIGAAAAGHLSIPRYSLGPGGLATVELPPAVTLAGQIVDPQGRPVAGASVEASPIHPGPNGWPGRRQTRTGAEGRFVLRGLPPRQGYRLFVQAEGFVSTLENVALGEPAQRARPVRIVLSRGITLTGRIVDPDGQPIAGADLTLDTAPDGTEETGYSMSLRMQAASETSGRFRLDHLGKGDYSLRVLHPGFAAAYRSGTVRTPRQAVVDLGDLILEPGVAIEGRVTDPRGKPVEGALVFTNVVYSVGSSFAPKEKPTPTGPDGSFRIDDLEGGRSFDLTIDKPGYVDASVPGVEAPTKEPLQIELRPARSLSVRVLDAERRPVAGAGIARVYESEPSLNGWSRGGSWSRVGWSRQARIKAFSPMASQSQTDDQGHYRIEGLGPGENQASAQALSSGLRTEGKVVLGDSGTYHLDLRFPSGVDVSGRVLDEQGEPLKGVALSIWSVRGAPAWSGSDFSVPSAADGSFRFPDVPDDTYRLSATAPGMSQAPDEVPEVVVAGREISGLVLRLTRGGAITGRLSGIAEEDRYLLSIEARREENDRSLSVTARDGTYRLAVPPGTWQVTASLPSGLAATGTASVGVGEEVVLDLEIPRGLTLSGRVLVDGQPLPEAQVSAKGSPGPEAAGPKLPLVSTRYDGSFAFHGLRPGPLTLSVVSRGIFHAQTLDLAADRQITVEIVTGGLSGSVLASTGEPIEGVRIALQGVSVDWTISDWLATARAITDESGSFEVPRLVAGSYLINTEADGFAPATQLVEVTPGGTTEIQVVLERGPGGRARFR